MAPGTFARGHVSDCGATQPCSSALHHAKADPSGVVPSWQPMFPDGARNWILEWAAWAVGARTPAVTAAARVNVAILSMCRSRHRSSSYRTQVRGAVLQRP